MKKKIIIIFLIIVCGCNHITNNKNSILIIDDIIINEKHNIKFSGVNSICVQAYGDSILITYYPDNNNIIIYSLKNDNAIDTLKFNEFYINSFKYINDDSIWIYGDYNYNQGCLFLLNKTGKIKQKFPLFDSIKWAYPIINDFIIINNKILFTLSPIDKNKILKKPVIGYLDLKKNKIILNNNCTYPFLTQNTYYPNGNFDYYFIGLRYFRKNMAIVSFRYTPFYYIWDIESNNLKLKKLKCQFIDTIPSETHPVEVNSDLPMYGEVWYSPKSEMFFRVVRFSKSYNNLLLYVYADKYGNYMGESLINNYYCDDLKTNGRFNLFSEKNQILTLINANFIFKKKNVSNILDTLKNIKNHTENEYCKINKQNVINDSKNIREYLKNKFNILDSSFSVIFINNYGCGSCNKNILRFITINKNVLFKINNSPFYLIFINENSNINSIISANENIINNNTQKRIKFDTSQLYSRFHPYLYFNPRLVLVKNNKIVSDTIYMPDNLNLLIERLLKFYNFDVEEK
ncbi:MAG: hypothetical protein HPY79_08900 [Bacteroidales bacterium]|nr:hypothetical protein [Bacteroidales bacterium]